MQHLRVVATALACVLLTALATVPASAAKPATWSASGTLTGTYANDVSWVQCPLTGDSGSTHETATLNTKILPFGRPQPLGANGIAVLMKMQAGGSWSVDGSYPPHVDLPNGDQGCGPQQPLHCAGQMVQEGDTMVLAFHRHGATLQGNFLQNAFVKEGEDPDSLCPVEASSGGPLFGIAGSQIEVDAFAENDAHPASIDVPVSRFRGHRTFAVTRTAGPDGGCARGYSACNESGRLALTLRFTPR